MDDKIDALLMKSQKFMQSAAVLLELEDFDSCVSRAYFSMFYAAQALMWKEGHRNLSNLGLRSSFYEAYVVTNRLPEKAGMIFNKAADLQEVADYGHGFAITRESAEYVLQEAEAFVNSLARLTEPLPDPTP